MKSSFLCFCLVSWIAFEPNHGDANSVLNAISKDDIARLKETNYLRDSYEPVLKAISSSNSIEVNNIEYSLDGFEQYSILSTDVFSLRSEGKMLETPLWKKKINETDIILVKDEEGKIECISIQGDFIFDLIPLKSMRGGSTDSNQEVFAVIAPEDYDNTKMEKFKKINDTEPSGHHEVDSFPEQEQNTDGRLLQTGMCTVYKIIDVAISYDATFCEKTGKNEKKTASHIQAIVGLASASYYERICLKLKISNIDGTCDVKRDKYAETAKSPQILEKFQKHWLRDKSEVERSVAHLFSGTKFKEGILGWAYTGTICDRRRAFGASWILWSHNIALQASLFAHELGHNAGASHYGTKCGNDLMAPCGSGLGGFSETSKSVIHKYLGKQNCLAVEKPIIEGSLSLTPRRYDYFHIRSSEYSSQALCLDLTLGYIFNGNEISSKTCQNTGRQKWRHDPKSNYIRSHIDDNKCITIQSLGIYTGYSIWGRLLLWDCPETIQPEFQWKFAGNGAIINMHRYYNENSGNVLVIQGHPNEAYVTFWNEFGFGQKWKREVG